MLRFSTMRPNKGDTLPSHKKQVNIMKINTSHEDKNLPIRFRKELETWSAE